MNKLKLWWHAHRERQRLARQRAIADQFNVTERNGKLYIMCNGTAVQAVASYASINEALQILDNARKTALDYEGE